MLSASLNKTFPSFQFLLFDMPGLCLWYFPGVGGLDGDGDIFNPDNQEAFTKFVLDQTDGKGVHFVMADGVRNCYYFWILLDRSFMVDPLGYFSFQPALHDWCNLVCGMVHIKEPLLLIGKSIPCGSSRFPLSLSEWSFTICLTPYNRK